MVGSELQSHGERRPLPQAGLHPGGPAEVNHRMLVLCLVQELSGPFLVRFLLHCTLGG